MSSDTTVYTTYPDAHVDERGRYFDGEFLSSQDFVDEQRYHVDRLRRALDHLTVSGVCEGLDVAPAGPWKLKLSPGVAIDGVGRQLVVLAGRDGVDVPKDIPGGALDVVLHYAEAASRVHGGSSDEDGTRGATRFRELPALEFVAAGQTPAHPDGVALARVRLGNDGAVSVDNPSPVRRTTGLRLPSTSVNGPTLRAGFARPQLLALSGDLQITGKLGVGTPDPEAELDVRGLARVGQLSVREQAFRVAGDEASFYPIVFRDLDWTAGQCVLEIVRPNAQADAQNAGSLMARLRWHAGDGHGSELLDVDVVQSRRFVANARTLAADRLLVVWLRGNRSYAWRSGQRLELVDLAAATKTLGGEKLDPRQSLEPAFDRDRYRLGPAREREEVRASLGVGGDLQYTGKLSHVDTAEVTAATVRAYDFFLGHSTRRGSPGRALVDNKAALVLNFDGDWPQLTLAGPKTQISGDAVLDKTLTVQGDLTVNAGNLKLTAGALTVARASAFTDQVKITRASEALHLVRARTNAGGSVSFLEIYQEDTSPATTPETFPFIRLQHQNRWAQRIESRANGLHLFDGNAGNSTYVDLFARTLKAGGDVTTDGALTVNKTATVTGNATFNAAVVVNRDADHLLLSRAKTNTGGLKVMLELKQQDDQNPSTPEVGTAIKFHHGWRYHHRIEARGDGLHIRTGATDSNDYSDLRAAVVYSNNFSVVTGKGERLQILRGIINDTGYIVAGSGDGFNVSRENGLTKITFHIEFASVPAVTVTQQYPNDGNGSDSGSSLDNAVLAHVTRQAAWVKTGKSNGDGQWRKFHFIAIGT